MPLIFPNLEGVGDQRYRITLEDTEYRARIWYGARFQCYYLSLFDADEQPIQTGMRLTIGFPQLVYNVQPTTPPGDLMANRFDVESDTAAFGTFGEDLLLGYYTADELARDIVSDVDALKVEPLP